jgi:hypothetical protein
MTRSPDDPTSAEIKKRHKTIKKATKKANRARASCAQFCQVESNSAHKILNWQEKKRSDMLCDALIA